MEKFENNKQAQINKEQFNKEIVRQNFDLWKKMLLSKNADKVAELYDENITFLPTLSEEFKKNKAEVKSYFEHFLEKNPVSEIVEDEVQVLSPDCYLHSGMYNFELGSSENKQLVEARFSFVWRKNQNGEWKIIHHHSSIKPKKE
jgi:uncharacterized protein (TIGR02246 family)